MRAFNSTTVHGLTIQEDPPTMGDVCDASSSSASASASACFHMLERGTQAAEKLTQLAGQGMLRSSTTPVIRADASLLLSEILRASLLTAETYGISLERSVSRRLRELMQDFPLPDGMILGEENRSHYHHNNVEHIRVPRGRARHPDVVTNAGAAPTPVRHAPPPQTSVLRPSTISLTAAVRLSPVGSPPAFFGIPPSEGPVVPPSTLDSPNSNVSNDGDGLLRMFPTLSSSSLALVKEPSGEVPSDSTAAHGSGSPSHGSSKLHSGGAGSQAPTAATISAYSSGAPGKDQQKKRHEVLEYVTGSLFPEITPLGYRMPTTDVIDAVHQEYLESDLLLHANPSFPAISPMTPAELARYALCESLPGAAQSLTALKRSCTSHPVSEAAPLGTAEDALLRREATGDGRAEMPHFCPTNLDVLNVSVDSGQLGAVGGGSGSMVDVVAGAFSHHQPIYHRRVMEAVAVAVPSIVTESATGGGAPGSLISSLRASTYEQEEREQTQQQQQQQQQHESLQQQTGQAPHLVLQQFVNGSRSFPLHPSALHPLVPDTSVSGSTLPSLPTGSSLPSLPSLPTGNDGSWATSQSLSEQRPVSAVGSSVVAPPSSGGGDGGGATTPPKVLFGLELLRQVQKGERQMER